MPEYPGVFVEELPGTFRSIGGVSPAIGGTFGLVSSTNILLGQAASRALRGAKSGGSSDWQYVNLRRELIFIEQSLSQGLQWVVFENNNPALWGKVSQSIENFLTRLWLSGALHGKRKDEAFFVACNQSTMTQNDIDNGRLIALVGVALIQPAEFVIFQIGAMTAQAEP